LGHPLDGFVASESLLNEAAARIPGIRVRPLSSGLGLLASTGAFFDFVTKGDASPLPAAFRPFSFLSLPLLDWATRLSRRGPLAYVESDYFGGVGSQVAVVWSGGRILLEPFDSRLLMEGERVVRKGSLGGAANAALRALGVIASPPQDELQAVGLGEYRQPLWI
jgi:hypothetical protein